MPPTFSHCGSLFWFKDGTVKRNQPRQLYGAAEMPTRTTGGYGELRPLTVPEFEAEKAKLRAKKAASPQLVRGSVEGSSPYIAHHSMNLYLEKVLEHIGKDDGNEKPIRFDQSYELPANGGTTRIEAERGTVVELKLKDSSAPSRIDNLRAEDSDDVAYLGRRFKAAQTEEGRPLTGSGWICLYFRVNRSERMSIDYTLGNAAIRHEVAFRSRR